MRPVCVWSALACLLAGGAAGAEGCVVVAVFDMEDRRSGLERAELDFLGDTLSAGLERGRRFAVVGPEALRRVLKSALAGEFEECFDRVCQLALGREVEADLALTSWISRVGGQCLVTAQLWNLKDKRTEVSAGDRSQCDRASLKASMQTVAGELNRSGPLRAEKRKATGPAPDEAEEPDEPDEPDKPWAPPTAAWTRIPAGSFDMGPHRPGTEARRVTLSRDFMLKTTEVTRAEWAALMDAQPAAKADCARCPVVRVSWWDAVAYCNALSREAGLETCYRLRGCSGTPGRDYRCRRVRFAGLDCTGYRLPTEAEWEYAARAGSGQPTAADLDAVAWYRGNSGDRPHRVASRRPNPWGLHDMLGNVFEWVHDAHGPLGDRPASDPTGPARGRHRVLRGGAFDSAAGICTKTRRGRGGLRARDAAVGFRPARSLERQPRPESP